MQLDKTSLDRLLALDDAALAKTIKALAAATGIDPRAAEAAVRDLRLVRQSLSNATDADLKKATDMLGKERTDALLRSLGDQSNGK